MQYTDAGELDRALVPAPLAVCQLVLERRPELHRDVAGLVEPPAFVLGLALVQTCQAVAVEWIPYSRE